MTHPLPPEQCAALYLRRSHRNAEGDSRNGRSLRDQEKECRTLAERLGLTVVNVFIEREGTSASRFSNKARPKYDSALRELEIGAQFRTLIVWSLDRADRRGAVAIAAILDKHSDGSRRIIGVDGTDTGDPRRRMEHIMRGELGREEIEGLSSRVSRAKRYQREDGLWLGGFAPYGLTVNEQTRKLEQHPERFPIARRIADRLLAGDSLWTVARDLNTDGIPSPRGGTWSISTLNMLVRSPGWAGLQSFREKRPDGTWPPLAEVFLTPEGRTVSVGERVITPGERTRLLGLLRSRRFDGPNSRGRRAPRHPLADVLRCDSCDGRMVKGGGSRIRVLRCATHAAGRVCPAPVNVPFLLTEEAVSLAFLARLAQCEPGDALLETVADAWVAKVDPATEDDRKEAEEALDAARARLSRVRDLISRGVYDDDDAAALMPSARAEVAAATEALARLPKPEADISPLLDLAQSVPAWEELPPEERRAILGMGITEVRAYPALHRGQRFEPADRLLILWADGTESQPHARRVVAG